MSAATKEGGVVEIHVNPADGRSYVHVATPPMPFDAADCRTLAAELLEAANELERRNVKGADE